MVSQLEGQKLNRILVVGYMTRLQIWEGHGTPLTLRYFQGGDLTPVFLQAMKTCFGHCPGAMEAARVMGAKGEGRETQIKKDYCSPLMSI